MKNKFLKLLILFLIFTFIISTYIFVVKKSVYAAVYKSIIDLWNKVEAPAKVELKTVKINPKETALLILDIEELTCNLERRPRCIDTVSRIKKFLNTARKKNMLVVYSLTNAGTPDTILPDVKPNKNEKIVKSSVDKFYNTELESILKENKIKTVIIAGTTAEGAVLHTATGASMRGFNVIVPVDGMSAGILYAEQYTVWHLINAPGTRRNTIVTSFNLIKF